MVLAAYALFLGAGLAVLRCGARAPAATPPGESVAGLIAAHRESEAVALARSRLARAEAEAGPDSLRTAAALDEVVTAVAAARDRGDLPEGRRLAERAVAIRRRLHGEQSPETASSLSGCAWLLWNFEEYRDARPYAEQALAIRSAALGPHDRQTAASLYQLGDIQRALGDYAGARRLLEQALEIWQTPEASDPEGIASCLHYLGVIRWTTGDYDGARSLIEQALAIRERALGPDSELVATGLNSLGSLELRMGDTAAAMARFRRAAKIWETVFGSDSVQLARSLENQGVLWLESGDLGAARRLLERAFEIRKRAFGSDHYLVARSLADLARVDAAAGDDAGADRLFLRALAIQQQDPLADGSEMAETLVHYAEHCRRIGREERALELAIRAETLAREDFLLKSRGLAQPEALRYEAVRSHGLDVALGALAAMGPIRSEGAAEGHVARVWDEVIRSRALVLDRMAARNRAAADVPRHGFQEVAARLPDDTCLVAYVRFAEPGGGHDGSTTRYLAFVLSAGGAPPAVVSLGTGAEIDRLVEVWRREAGTDPRSLAGREADARCAAAGRHLRRAIWDPLADAVAGRRRVLVVPDGAISLVSLAALPREDGGFLLDSPARLHYLSAERDLTAAPSAPGSGVLALGGVDFDAAPGIAGRERRATPACVAFEALRFDPLSGSKREAEEVASVFRGLEDVRVLTGTDAGKTAFKRAAPGHRILHLATHGFSLEGRCVSMLGAAAEHDGVTVGDNPLLLSGLAMAGANRHGESGDAADDGLITAAEIGALDLTGVEWAVLSGCETGLGRVVQGEGVLGLRRAFQIAGAGTLIMSLWPVDDGAARVWMRHLYEARLEGMSTIDAVAGAGLAILNEQRRLGRSTHPYFWGAFVAAGDWR